MGMMRQGWSTSRFQASQQWPPPEGYSTPGTEEAFLTAKELAARWSCSVKSLSNDRSLRKGADLPFIRLGRLIRYRLSDVLAFEAKGRVGP